jgi:uncharacterized protein (TIRG00374 family)
LKKQLLNLLKFLAFLSVGLSILYVVYRSQNKAYVEDCALKGIPPAECGQLLDKVLADFASANYAWLAVVLLAFLISNVSRAIRWNMLLHQLGYRPRLLNGFLTIILGYFANLGLPRVGEVVRAGAMARYERIPVEQSMGTVVVDRVIDVISILLITGLALVLEFDTIWAWVERNPVVKERVLGAVPILLALAGAGLLSLVLIYRFWDRVRKISLIARIEGLILGFVEGIRTVSKLDRPWLFILHSVNIWVMYFLMTYLCFFAFAPTASLTAIAGLVVFVFGGWGIVIPSPGGMGTYHFLVGAALALYGIAGDDAFSFANIAFFSIQIGCNVIVGLAALLLLPVLNRAYVPQHAATGAA